MTQKKKESRRGSQLPPIGRSIVAESEAIDLSALPDLDEERIAILPLRGEVLFPRTTVPVLIGREKSLALVREAAKTHEVIFAVTQRDAEVEDPTSHDLYRTGSLCRVMKLIEMPDGNFTALMMVEGVAKLRRITRRMPWMCGKVEPIEFAMPDMDSQELQLAFERVEELYIQILDTVGEEETRELRAQFDRTEGHIRRIYFMCNNSPLDVNQKVELLGQTELLPAVMLMARFLGHALGLMKIKNEINLKTKENITRQQREHFLQQQIQAMQNELGGSVEDIEFDELVERAETKKWDAEARKHFDKELRKLERYNPQNPEYSIQYGYLETLLNLPWDDYSEQEIKLEDVRRVLDEDHYGLDKVKERIVEQMAVIKLRGDMKAPIICLYGPPGVGKTSLGHSIARALGRSYARVSLGGMHDEAELRGHRRTYIGAMPGRIISGLIKAEKGNPVFVLDEIDKVGADFKGDPSTALLEVLDPEQNSKFHDNYVDYDYDLSKVMFIATANDLSTVSRPLLDRMEIIEIGGYITDEKVEIASRHLIPRNLADHGLSEYKPEFTREAITYIIERYTREAGVRQLDKKIAKVMRRLAMLKASGKPVPERIGVDTVREFLGAEEIMPDMYENNDFTGVVTGLAWTQAGGDILFIEVSLAPGKGEKLTLTGNLGDVMKESAVIALQYLKSHAAEVGIAPEMFAKNDVHIHVPEGAIPKDGPSAGITMLTALASAFTGRKVRPKLAMTGEITLRGKVLPVGGLKEKMLAAKRAGITDVILCSANRKDIEEISPRYLEGLEFHYVDRMEDVLRQALLPAGS